MTVNAGRFQQKCDTYRIPDDGADPMAERLFRAVTEIGGAAVQRFAARIKGRVIMPDDGLYESERLVWNRIIDKRPGMIVECSEVEDVIRAVNFARDNSLLTAVRAGRHSLSGKSVCDGGIVIDVGRM